MNKNNNMFNSIDNDKNDTEAVKRSRKRKDAGKREYKQRLVMA